MMIAPPSTNHQLPKLLAPAGNWDCAKAAVENGADAIYFGLDRFNARMRADNFTTADLPKLMCFLHRRGVQGFITFNTLVFSDELAAAETYLREIITAGVDAAIVQDVGLCRLIRHLSPDFPIHASTQMTVTSAVGVEFAYNLGCELVVLARETAIADINKIQSQLAQKNISLPLEVFVHGALCVAYSGQCLTSEALGGRSANRGECAQACRMPYELIVDGEKLDLDERQYLLSPQDLAGFDVIAQLVETGVACLKIEGRLKTPEYVASVTKVYRQALDQVAKTQHYQPSERDRYTLEMAFSRGLYTGWFEGIDNQQLVHGRFGKKRGVYIGEIAAIHGQTVLVNPQASIKAGDGIVFDQGRPDQPEMGGRIYTVEPVKARSRQSSKKLSSATVCLRIKGKNLNFKKLTVGDKIWKTSDPEWEQTARQSFAGEQPRYQRPIQLKIQGQVGEVLSAIAQDEQGHSVQTISTMALVIAQHKPLTTATLTQQFGRLGNTPFYLESLDNQVTDVVMLPVSELNRMRRDLVAQLVAKREQNRNWQLHQSVTYHELLPERLVVESITPELIILVRNTRQLEAVLEAGLQRIYCELEDPQKCREIVSTVRQFDPKIEIWIAPPRITKPKENYILEQVIRAEADGYLIRNYDQLKFFAQERKIGDFSLNIANPITAAYFQENFGLERLTASYDLNIEQLTSLLQIAPPHWFEVTLHQHMPMFHMEHCVFCAFLSDGKDFRDCGRPCEQYEVKLRDRVGTEHVLQADAGCRNTVFNGVAQTGVESLHHLIKNGLRFVRLEFLNESPQQVIQTLQAYQQVLRGEMTGVQLWRKLNLQSQLGVTRGAML